MTRALIVIALLASVARADDDETDSESDATFVSGELRGTTAVFHARYMVKVEGQTQSWGTRTLVVPDDAALTNVVVRGPDGTQTLALVEAEKAKKKFEDTDGVTGGKRWAVLVERDGSNVTVSSAAPRDATLAFDVELQMPTCFYQDVRYAAVPVAWKRVLVPSLRRRSSPDACTGALPTAHPNPGDAEDILWVAFPSAALARKPAGPDRVGTNAARLDLGETHIARLELAVSKSLAEVPRDLATAIIVDGSRSMSPLQLEAQRELVKAYARAAGETQIQVVAYARTARALLPSWTTARAASVRLDRELRAIAPRNGSNIDAGVVEAARWLAQVPGTKRVVLLTDALLAERVAAGFDALAKKLPPNTLVHVVVIDEAGALEREDGFGKTLAEGSGGLAARAGIPDEGAPIDATMLLRPIRIDNLAITAPGWNRFSQTLQSTCSDRLDEGHGCEWWAEGDVVAGPLSVTGKIWGKRFSRLVTPDGARQTELARALSSMNVLDERGSERAKKLARAANSAWSFYGEWGGAGGYESGNISISGGCCGWSSHPTPGHRFSIGHAIVGMKLPVVDLSPQFAHVIARCGLGDAHVEATIELTGAEIVDVRVLAPPNVARCVEDEIWDTAVTPPPPHAFKPSTRVVLVH